MISADRMSLVYGIGLAFVDVIVLGIVKKVYSNVLPSYFIYISMIIYGMTPLLFLKAMKSVSLTVMNLTWDLSSDILVTLLGMLYFKEMLSQYEIIGALLGGLALLLFSLK